MGHEVYAEHFRLASLEGLLSDDELLSFLIREGYWDVERNKLLDSIPKDIEQFKVSLYENQFKSNEKAKIRKYLKVAKDKLQELFQQRGSHDHLSCSGVASLARSKFLIGCSVFRNGKPVFHEDELWQGDSDLLEQIMHAYGSQKLDEATFRELARTEPWRSIWANHKIESSLFGVPSIDYTEDQRSLVCWSMLYENVSSHPNAPSDDVINDDDVLDGWLIKQRKSRDESRSNLEEIVPNEKIRDSQEVFLVADTHEDARKIDALNSEQGSFIKQARFQALSKAGTLDEMEMPDTKRRVRAEITKRLSQSMGGS